MKLTEKDRDLLLALYEMPHWAAFRKVFLEEHQLEMAMQAPFAGDMQRVAELKGMIVRDRDIEKDMKSLHDAADKQEKAKNG